MPRTGKLSATPRDGGVADHPWIRWLAHFGLGLSGAGGCLPEVPEPVVAVSHRRGSRS